MLLRKLARDFVVKVSSLVITCRLEELLRLRVYVGHPACSPRSHQFVQTSVSVMVRLSDAYVGNFPSIWRSVIPAIFMCRAQFSCSGIQLCDLFRVKSKFVPLLAHLSILKFTRVGVEW